MSSVLLGGPPSAAAPAEAGAPATPPRPPGLGPAEPAGQRSQTLTILAGVGVLLLAMGVGVLIGRASAGKQATPPAPVITVDGGGTASTPAGTGASESVFTSDWPAGTKKGYTVRLQTLPESGTSVSAVAAAKTAATGKGAKTVGALKSEEFSSLSAGTYVIYSGVYHKRAEAQKALASLKKSFPAASVIEVSNGSAGSSGTEAAGSGATGSSTKKPAPPSVLKSLKSAHGKAYEEQSKNLPDEVET